MANFISLSFSCVYAGRFLFNVSFIRQKYSGMFRQTKLMTSKLTIETGEIWCQYETNAEGCVDIWYVLRFHFFRSVTDGRPVSLVLLVWLYNRRVLIYLGLLSIKNS